MQTQHDDDKDDDKHEDRDHDDDDDDDDGDDHDSLPKFNIAPEKWWLEDYFPFGMVNFQGLR